MSNEVFVNKGDLSTSMLLSREPIGKSSVPLLQYRKDPTKRDRQAAGGRKGWSTLPGGLLNPKISALSRLARASSCLLKKAANP
jgi:hypothetical protein